MSKLVVLFLVASTISCWAYDFQDSYYDHYFDDGQLSDARNKRETAKFCWRQPTCCGHDTMKKFFESHKDQKKECFKAIFDDKDPLRPPADCQITPELKNKFMCMEECFFKKLELTDANGKVDESKFKALLNNLTDEQWFKTIKDAISENCMTEYKSMPASPDGSECKHDSMFVKHCVFKNLQLLCPDDQVEDKEQCSKLRETIKEGTQLLME